MKRTYSRIAIALLLALVGQGCGVKDLCRDQLDCLDGYVCRNEHCANLNSLSRCYDDANCFIGQHCVTFGNADQGYCLDGDPGAYCTENADCFFDNCSDVSAEGVGVCAHTGDSSGPDGEGSCQRDSDCTLAEFCIDRRCVLTHTLTCNQIGGSCQDDFCAFGTETSAQCSGAFEMCCASRD